MNGLRAFIDTAFVQALFNRADQHHARASQLAVRLPDADELWTTEAVLVEIGNALSGTNRRAAVEFIEEAYQTPEVHVVSVDTEMLRRALELYKSRSDKNWGLTDCISFLVMEARSLQDALTSDRHFQQAGYRALLLEKE
ncbi:MAG: PIN domain-containing protein [Planctomycetota bacterium]|nr:PIN domain-containing protein [Planctomycetota bacterium]